MREKQPNKRRSDLFADTVELKKIKKKDRAKISITNTEHRDFQKTAEGVITYMLIIALTLIGTITAFVTCFALYGYFFNQEALEKCINLISAIILTISIGGAIFCWIILFVLCIVHFFDH